MDLANELEITKAITYLKEKDLAKVWFVVSIKLTVTQLHDYSTGTNRNTMFTKLTLFTN